MSPALQSNVDQPLGRMFSFLGKSYLHLLRNKLQHLEIDRNYFALILIENNEGEINQQQLALMLDTDNVSIVRVVDYLSEKGFVKRVRTNGDRRKHNLLLTEKAKAALPEIKHCINELNQLVFSGLSENQQSELLASLANIKNSLTGNTQKT
jgi:MarR family transcriptional regulator for hemolysin